MMINIVKLVCLLFLVFCGYDDYLLNMMLLGGDGVIIVSVNFVLEFFVGIYCVWCEGDLVIVVMLNKKLL